ncbi:DUF3515 domain-containing protein [Planosporangium flavigriseum]|uniref:DUF3515 domain-containing protein n=1 Tax=Planosporangium flavigriseum TaxID=373681 RepID=A0A8J3LGR6_9ACTN|nr:DUF3515 domain-containing protein [Planosporangium flavigriseum]NJC64161.1 DUF3515 domain-containing protein [Planosporangium flavigriseum]GIG73043.1 hypothetical protein Pfl04_14470 [Planosporangium flavigriseum]
MAQGTTATRLATLIAVPVAIIVGIASFWFLGGFRTNEPARPRPQSTAPVQTSARPLDPAQAAACRELLTKLPGALRDRPRRPVTAGEEQNAAYGDPAIVLACGVPPISVPPTADVYVLSGVCWYSQPGGGTTEWTTVDRTIPVRVTVPSTYSAPGQWVIEFSPPVAATLPRAATVPAGCQ